MVNWVGEDFLKFLVKAVDGLAAAPEAAVEAASSGGTNIVGGAIGVVTNVVGNTVNAASDGIRSLMGNSSPAQLVDSATTAATDAVKTVAKHVSEVDLGYLSPTPPPAAAPSQSNDLQIR